MYEQVETGPLYDKTVKLLSTYRSIAARMTNAKVSTQGKLDRRLEALAERIAESLSELTTMEREALTCWKHSSVFDGQYEVDYDAIIERPYVSIRRIDRWDEEQDDTDAEPELSTEGQEARRKRDKTKLDAFLRIDDDI
ncbi:hypothetical protein RAZWK3B_12589 [Roseobacter sp. AzwK-3b]|uniref:hypothetical protein n=1 Tax=Roseobacter sp. AzwK-3b TaxID=351016 RepID=UPI000156A09F|nr:hypothetical protein [Roseobacter sp. AzwK-3b]EDM69427.1 hypothetical protein RAZWK3B_12589 [Roseobacter sp. AzwK-3b]